MTVKDVFALTMEFRQLQSTATLTAFYQHAKPIVEQSIKDALHLGLGPGVTYNYYPRYHIIIMRVIEIRDRIK
jgi:hypothetical protein